MEPADSLVPLGASLGAVAAVTAAVLSDVVAYDRRVRGPRDAVRVHQARPEPERPGPRDDGDGATGSAMVGGLAGAADAAAADAPRAAGGDAPDAPHGREVPEVPQVPHPAADDDSMLGAWTATDVDERSPLRRVLSALVLLTLTLLTAGLLGAAIYRGLQSLS